MLPCVLPAWKEPLLPLQLFLSPITQIWLESFAQGATLAAGRQWGPCSPICPGERFWRTQVAFETPPLFFFFPSNLIYHTLLVFLPASVCLLIRGLLLASSHHTKWNLELLDVIMNCCICVLSAEHYCFGMFYAKMKERKEKENCTCLPVGSCQLSLSHSINILANNAWLLFWVFLQTLVLQNSTQQVKQHKPELLLVVLSSGWELCADSDVHSYQHD